jgi:hypothetical protein
VISPLCARVRDHCLRSDPKIPYTRNEGGHFRFRVTDINAFIEQATLPPDKPFATTSAYPGLNTGQVGAIGELRTSADLLAKGYHVFRAVSPTCPCDLIALKGGKCLRLQVRTARKLKSGKLTYPTGQKDAGRQDYYAAVLPDRIEYFPPLEP